MSIETRSALSLVGDSITVGAVYAGGPPYKELVESSILGEPFLSNIQLRKNFYPCYKAT